MPRLTGASGGRLIRCWGHRRLLERAEGGRVTVDRVRTLERFILNLCVNRAHMPRKIMIQSFPENETNLKWIDQYMTGHEYSAALTELAHDIKQNQTKLAILEKEFGLNISQLIRIVFF